MHKSIITLFLVLSFIVSNAFAQDSDTDLAKQVQNPVADLIDVEYIYDEKRAPRLFVILGIVNIIQAPMFIFLGYLCG